MISLSALTFMRLVLFYSDTPVRLTGHNVSFAGRVEVFSHGVWGRVMDTSGYWDHTEAAVVCKQLGFPRAVTALRYSPFGEGSGPVLMPNVQCTGSEKTLQQCQYKGWLESSINSGREVGVICKTHEFDTVVSDISMRLQGSSVPNAGRVEVLYAGIWGAISKTNWDINDATVVCRQLGYQAGAEAALTNGVYGPVSGPVWITNLQCSGSETNVMSCSHDGIGNKSESQRRQDVASVICKDSSLPNRMLVRLRGSPSPNMGRVELYYAGMWGAIYYSSWDIKDAAVVCRQLGYSTTVLTGRKLFCSVDFPLWFRNFRCYGNETSLDQCARDFYRYTWSFDNCANVVCSDSMADSGFDIRLTDSSVAHAGRVELRFKGIWGTIYVSSWFHHDEISFDGVICRQLNFSDSILAVGRSAFGPGTGPLWFYYWNVQCQGDENNLQNCTFYRQPQLTSDHHDDDLSIICKPDVVQTSDFHVRLTGSNFAFAGTIEVMYYGVWGGILGRGYVDISVGHVVCRQLGYPGAHEIFQYSVFGPVKGPLWIWRIHCNGNETNISDCTMTTWDNITYRWYYSYYQRPSWAAGVLCREATSSPSKMLNVRLVGAPISNAGRVEVLYAGVWGTVSSWGWDINATHVVCRQLGYPAALSSGYNNQFGLFTGPAWFRNVKCLGNETNFGECSKDLYGYPYSGSYAAIALCKLPYESDTPPKCSEISCKNNGSCIQSGVGAICNCTEGFMGVHCEKSLSNPCQSSPCENGGKCFSNGFSYVCSCFGGLTGQHCEKRIEINEPSPTQESQTSKTPFIVVLSVLAALVVLLIAAVVYLIVKNRRLSKHKPTREQAEFSNMAYRSDEEETYYSNDVDLGTGTNHTSNQTREKPGAVYETVTSRPLPPIPPPHNAARKNATSKMNSQAAPKKADSSSGGVTFPRGAEEHYMGLSKKKSNTDTPNTSAVGGPNPNEYMSLSPTRPRDISYSAHDAARIQASGTKQHKKRDQKK